MPIRHTDEIEGWGNVLWQAAVLLGLGSLAAAILSSSPFAIVVYALLVLLALTFSAVFRLQGRVEVVYTREELIDARKALGRIITEAGDLLIARDDRPFSEQAFDIFKSCLDLFRGDSPFFDESHEGRFYAVSTEASAKGDSDEALREGLIAEIKCLNDFIGEINAELNSLPRFR